MYRWEHVINHIKRKHHLFNVYVASEEYSAPSDQHGRFLFKFSNRTSTLDPVVSAHLIENKVLEVEWPEHYRFAVCLTHDVDYIYPPIKHIVAASKKAIARKDMREFLKRLSSRVIKKYNPYLNFKDIMMLEEKYDARSTFFFKASRKEYGQIYNVESISSEIAEIAGLGWEVGLHAGYFSYDDPDELRREKERLEKVLRQEVIGVRIHYLRFKVPDTWFLLADVGFKYDTTFGFADMPGFRNGMCHPFRPCTIDGRIIDIWEIPLIVMDTTLFGYLHTTPKKAFDMIKLLCRRVEKYNGVITILWHNNTFDELRYGEWSRLYRAILKYLKERNAWMTNGRNIYEYWNSIYG